MSLSWNLVANLRFFFERNNCFDGIFILGGGPLKSPIIISYFCNLVIMES